jgi:hypothetical protein
MTGNIACMLALLLAATTLEAGAPDFRTGDIALIGGQTGAGQAVSAADPSRSGVGHCGIIVLRDDVVWFVHADVYTSMVIAERWADYAPVRDNTDLYILLRHDDASAASRAAEIAWRFVEQRVPFDTAFDDGNSKKLYCTELVMVAYARASAVLAVPERMRVRMPFVSNRVVHPAGLMLAPGVSEVTRSEGKGDQ